MSKIAEVDVAIDDRLARLGREWFAEVRAKHPKPKDERKRRGENMGGDSDGFWDRFFSSDGDCDGGDAGD